MTCPHCSEHFPLTWPRYWGAPFGKHSCPRCGNTSKLGLTSGYVAVTLSFWIVITAVAIIASFALDDRVTGWYWFGTFLVGLIFGLPIDKWLDQRLRTLRPITK